MHIVRRISMRTLSVMCAVCCLVILLRHSRWKEKVDMDSEVVVLCPSSQDDEDYLRWSMSAGLWGARGEPLGRERTWRGYGSKVALLRERLRDMLHNGRAEHIVLYTDSHDVLFVGPLREVVSRFKNRGDARVLFAAELGCSPDGDHATRRRYPHTPGEYPYLNAGVIIGYVSTLYELVTLHSLPEHENDQRYYTQIYLNVSLRTKLRLRLDHRAEIFQCLVNASDHVRVIAEGTWALVENTLTGSRPLLLHGNGPSEGHLWALETELVRAWAATPNMLPPYANPQKLAALARAYGLTNEDEEESNR